jgi:lipopolysaccharide/colanic/teichoic acid biosynthesis glycosyltransferase
MRPGITGLGQTFARYEANFSERASYDADSFNEIALKTDLLIMLKTVNVVLKGKGC